MGHDPKSVSVRISHSRVCVVAHHGPGSFGHGGIVGKVELIHLLHILFSSGVGVCI
jgi:hypothetical protein